jgi:protein arginine N-methyltransferase 1
MYSIADYGRMIADDVRMDAFARALKHAVRPGSVVADIGTGTGIFALLACRFGARRVFAIEPNDAIQVAREIAAANGCADRIEFFQACSTDVTLPERADVIVSDIGGALPWHERHIHAIVDARERLLARGGVLIPRRDAAWTAVIEAPATYAELTSGWDYAGFDMSAARHLVLKGWRTCRLKPEDLLTKPERWGETDYATVTEPNVRAILSCSVRRAGTGHGLAAGFDRTVGEGIALSNAPDAPEPVRPRHIYGIAFFPWPRPVDVVPGDVLTVEINADFIGEDYVWSWKTRVLQAGDPNSVTAAFDQSTFYGTPLSPAQLRKRASSHVPTLSEEGRTVRLVLELMRARLSLSEIADRLREECPERFASPADALNYAGRWAKEFGE